MGEKSAIREAVKMAAGCLIATGGTLAGLPVPPGAVEAVFAGGAWFGALSSARRRDLERVLDRTADEVEAEMAAWVPRSSQTDLADLAHAKASFIEVLPDVMPPPIDLATRNFGAAAIAELVLERAEAARPDIYKDKGPKDPANQLARRFLRQVIEHACARLLADAEFIDGLRPVLWRELLERTGRIEGNTEKLLDGQRTQDERMIRIEAMLVSMEEKAVTARASGISDEALIKLARNISPRVFDPLQAFRELENAVEIAVRVQREGRQGSNLGAFVDEVLARVAALAATGAYNEATAAIDAALAEEAEEERRIEERRQESRTRSLRLLDAGIEQDLLRRDAESAAARLVRKAEIERPERASLFDHLHVVQREWYERGRNEDLALALEVSIPLTQRLVELSTNTDQLGISLNTFGNALKELGTREAGTGRLEQAVAAYRLTLEEFTRERTPLQWAGAQTNLGSALAALGAREAGAARLEQAVEAYRLALEEWTRERVPLEWAMTQNNLGNALAELGRRESGIARLEQAVAAYRMALKEQTRERVPFDWAMTQNNLGNALQALGTRESGTARLEQAVAAYRLALEEWTRERVPLQWGATQTNLGAALQELGAREFGTARLQEAVEAYRFALEELTQERVPLQWAATQDNLGNALAQLGIRKASTTRLWEAVAAYRLALEERTRERVPLQWAATQSNLGNTLQELGRREQGTARLEEALVALGLALAERMRERVPLEWAATQNNIGNALTILGIREKNSIWLQKAINTYRSALEERTRERVPLQWAMTQNNLGNALAVLGEGEAGTEQLERAVDAYRLALEEWTSETAPHYHDLASQNLARAQALLDERRKAP